MIKYFLFCFFLCLLYACKEQFASTHRKYEDFDNDLERINLQGKVRQTDESTTLINAKDASGNARQTSRTVTYFNDHGNVMKMELFDQANHLNGFRKFEYNEQNLTKSIVLRNNENELNDTIEYRYDADGNTIYQKEIRQGKTRIYENEYDSLKNVIRQHRMSESDSTTMHYDYVYDDKGKKKMMEITDPRNLGGKKIQSRYAYDLEGNLIEEVRDGGLSLSEIRTYVFEKGKMIKRRMTRNGIEWEVVKYDANFNPIEEKTTKNGKSYDVLFHSYTLDEHQNWIRRETSKATVDETTTSPARPYAVTTRKIVYE